MLVLLSCAPHPKPRSAAPAPAPPPRVTTRLRASTVARVSLVGFVCPTVAAGRPAFLAAALRRESDWTDAAADLRTALARGSVHELEVLGYAGRRAGRFTLLGPVDLGRDEVAALGAYAGSLPCFDPATASECGLVSRGCGLAAGATGLEDAPHVPARGGCAMGGMLVVDIDGDHIAEAFALGDLMSLPEEVGAAAGGAARCEGRFSGPLAEDLDLLGVADLDLDGRVEVAVGRRAAKEAAIYSASESAHRLVRVGMVRL
jgi:hypothetical protein